MRELTFALLSNRRDGMDLSESGLMSRAYDFTTMHRGFMMRLEHDNQNSTCYSENLCDCLPRLLVVHNMAVWG